MTIENQLKVLPEKPGCYLYYNQVDKVIYVGKAKNLKKRVNSYFNKVHNFKTTKLVRDIVRVETIITSNEKESLLLEQNLIKKYKPRYNVVLNDDKKYPYIAITKEKDPQYLYVRNYDSKNQLSFGPFPEGTSARNILRTLERIYPLRRCKGNLKKPCIYYHINQCSGACFQEVDAKWYENQIQKIKDFFSGKSDDIKIQLERKMEQAAANLQFEEAQRIKEVISHLSFTTTAQDVDLSDHLNRDIFNYFEYEDYLCFSVLFYRSGKLTLKNSEVIKFEGQDIIDLFKSYILQIYSKNILPDYIVIPNDIECDDLIVFFENKLVKSQDLLNERLLDLALNNCKEFLFQEMHYKNKEFSKTNLLNDLQNLLSLNTFPYQIEMYDIANILNEFVTGAMVVYKNGFASTNDFRRYNIDIDSEGDYHRMHELVLRRYKKDKNLQQNFADLIIMDGGMAQVHAAKKALHTLKISIPVIGLVKNIKHKTEYIIGLNEEKIIIDKHSQLFRFLESLQLRVHNYAISSFRKRQSKEIIKDNVLSPVQGIGNLKIKKLYEKFETISNMKQASFDELDQVIKNKTTTETLYKHLKTITIT